MDRIEAMRVFCKVVECGSFAAAAHSLNYSTSAVSRFVAQLENHLNARLLNRTTRRLSLTESGQAYFERCVQWLMDLEEVEAAVSEQATSPRGTLKITTSVEFGMAYLAPVLAAFQREHPDMSFNIILSGRRIDLVEEGVDLAIRIGAVGSTQLVARRVGNTKLLTLASPHYLQTHTPILTPHNLYDHPCLSYEHEPLPKTWSYKDVNGQLIDISIRGTIHSDHGAFLPEMASRGMGIARAPCFIAGPYLKNKTLERILTDFELDELPVHAVYPCNKHLSAKVRVFIRFLEQFDFSSTSEGGCS